MLCFLLFFSSFLSAAYQDSAKVFYSDLSHRKTREMMLPEISTGPALELDAYLTYISDIAYLSSRELCTQPVEVHKAKLLSEVYRNYSMLEVKSPDCVESVIEFGLQQLTTSILTPAEIKAYNCLNKMILDLSDTLSPDKQRSFWLRWIALSTTLEDKALLFDVYLELKSDLQTICKRLKQYNELLEQALSTQCLAVPTDHESDK